MNNTRSTNNKLRFLAYIFVACAVAFSVVQSNRAIDLAREIDHRGDIRACQQENLIRQEANQRNAKLEVTAGLVVRALTVIGNADRKINSTTNFELKVIAKEAKKVQRNFAPAKIANCEKVFPGP